MFGRPREARGRHYPPEPVTLPVIKFEDALLKHEMEDAARLVAERRTLRLGLDAWHAIGRAENFEAWKAIGAALAIGKAYALRVTGANQAWGSTYSRAFSAWIREHGFDKMSPPTRSVAIELHENIAAIEAWRTSLPERQRKRLVHPLSVTRRWRRESGQGTESKRPVGTASAAKTALMRFIELLARLPAEQAQSLRQDAIAALIA